MCDACHMGSHYECVARMGADDEQGDILDASAGWRCRGCVTRNRCGVSALLDSLAGDDGKERLLIRWYKPPSENTGPEDDTCCQRQMNGTVGAQEHSATRWPTHPWAHAKT